MPPRWKPFPDTSLSHLNLWVVCSCCFPFAAGGGSLGALAIRSSFHRERFVDGFP